MSSTADSSTAPQSRGSGTKMVSTTVDHSRLLKTDSAAIRSFLRSYDQYAKEVEERARQLIRGTVVTQLVSPVHLKFCVDADWIESSLTLGFIADISSYEDLTDEQLRSYLEKKAEESKEVVTFDKLDKLVENKLRTDMTDSDARFRIENLFVSYLTLLRRNGLSWIIRDNEKVAVFHIVSAIRPETLRARLEPDLELSHHSLRKDFKGFMAHAINLSEAFQLVDNGGRKQKGPSKYLPRRGRGGDESSPKEPKKPTKKAPICPYEPHKSKGSRHLLKDCTACTDEEKTALFKKLADEKAGTGPSKSTRGEKERNEPNPPVAERLQPTVGNPIASPFTVTFCDGSETMTAQGRADDGSDESIVSSAVAEKAILNGIGKLTKIDPVSLQVALKQGDNIEQFTFSRIWTPPRTVLQLSAGPLALVNVTHLVADADLAAESLLIGLSFLQHLDVDTKTLLEERRDRLDGADCSAEKAPTSGSGGIHVSRLMIARLNHVTNNSVKPVIQPDDNRHCVDFFKVREEVDTFPDASLLDPLDFDQHDEIEEALESMVQDAKKNGLP